MALLYVLPNTATGFETITTSNTVSNPLTSTVVDPSTDYRLFKVRLEGNVDMSFKLQYANTDSGPWVSYNLDSEVFDNNGGATEIYVNLLNSKYHRVIVWNTDTTDGQVKVTIDTDPIVSYVSIEEVRDYLKIQASEYDDSQISQMTVRATREVDQRTGRTWQAVRTVTDEYVTPGDELEVRVDNVDLQSVTALSVDTSDSGSYTSVTPSTLRFTETGMIRLTSSSEVAQFPLDNKTQSVKVSYTYGNTNPTYYVKDLTLFIIRNMIFPSDENQREIQLKVNKLVGQKYIMA